MTPLIFGMRARYVSDREGHEHATLKKQGGKAILNVPDLENLSTR